MRLSFLLFFFFFCILQTTFSQNYKYRYQLNENFASVKESEAVFIGKGLKEADLFRLDCFDKITNMLLVSCHFTDSSLSILEGNYISYFRNGKKEIEGMYHNSVEDGLWRKWDKDGNFIDSTVYDKGRISLSVLTDYNQEHEKLTHERTDSINDTYTYTSFFRDGSIREFAEFKGNEGLLKEYDSTGMLKNTEILSSREMREAQYPDGTRGFKNHLEKNLDGAVATDNKAPTGTYTIIIKFSIETDGSLSDITPETNVGYGMENEAVRVIRSSGKWIPAIKFGKLVKAYRRQPIVFAIMK